MIVEPADLSMAESRAIRIFRFVGAAFCLVLLFTTSLWLFVAIVVIYLVVLAGITTFLASRHPFARATMTPVVK